MKAITRVPTLLPSLWLLIVLLVSQAAHGQDRNPARGIQAGSSYAVSDIETVNLTNGNLMLNIPLAVLPGGRGSAPSYSVTLRYNSKLWNSRQERGFDNIPDDTGNGYYFRELLERSEEGGWHLDAGEYQLRMINRQALEAEAHCTVGNGSEYTRNGYRYRLEMQTPDGSVIEFRPYGDGVPFRDLYGDSWFSIDPGGVRHAYSLIDWTGGGTTCRYELQQVTSAGMHYYSTDGSGLRLYVPPGQYNGSGDSFGYWKLFKPDGSLIEHKPPDAPDVDQRLTDRNGNRIVWKVAQDGKRIQNDVGQYIVYGPGGVLQKGFGGEVLVTGIEWDATWVHRSYPLTHAPNSDPNNRTGYVREGLSVVTKITLPSQLGQQEFRFTYNGTTDQPEWGNYTPGWGEMTSVTLPSGARAGYTFAVAPTQPVLDAYEVVNNSVARRDLTHVERYDGMSRERTESTVYSTNGVGVATVTTPDGRISTEVSPFAGRLKGYVYRSISAGGAINEKIWAENFDQRTHATGGPTNPYVKTEFNTVADRNGNPSLTAIKDYDYDQNGNVLEIREYDWISYSSIPRNGTGLYSGPTGLPTGLTLKRRTRNTYYNPTPAAGDVTLSPNHYANPSAPRLQSVVRSSELLDGNGRTESLTEFYYDDSTNVGNLIETRRWDSSRGPITSPDGTGNRLNAGNSISTRFSYDQYGNVTKTTDPRGVESVNVYGDVPGPEGNVAGLYRTLTVAAVNHPAVSRTSSASYDFHTGAVITATDVDNAVSTVTEYDALARPIKVRGAANTAAESWTRTEYDDAGRRITVRSDVESPGDGRKVSVRFFDQLGRIRLEKTLEDAATQSAANETDGIKVQTRYGFDDPTPADPSDPENTRGSYTLVSSPFRAAATGVATEPTMGWTLAFSSRNGRTSTATTFDGGDLPTAFGGANSRSTGTVLTELDADSTTVTDQSGRKRRSIVDALGRLTRADEPNVNGDLGSVLSPVQPTHYFYNARDNLVRVKQEIQNRYFMFDSLGRLLRLRQPEQTVNPALATSGNPDNNAWNAAFTYDANGNPLTSTDANGVTITSAYDALGRIRSRAYSDATPPVTFGYDSSQVPHSRGRLTTTSSAISETRILAYDPAGRISVSEQVTDGKTYRSAHKYALNGAVVEQLYPTGRVVRNFLQADGDVGAVSSKVANGTFQSYAAEVDYSASGLMERLQFGNGLWESASLNARNQVIRLGLSTTLGGPALWRLDYQYGELDASGNVDGTRNSGNVARQAISGAGQPSPFVQTYRYDSLNRLTEAKELAASVQTWRQTFDYDRYGNRVSFTQVVGAQQLPITNMTLPQIDSNTNRFQSGQGYLYDASGNLTRDAAGQQFVFNGDSKQTEVRDAQGNVVGRYYYDGNGNRVKKTTLSESTTFVYDGLGKLVAEMSTTSPPSEPTVNYTATDTLGSPRILTNARGQIVARRDFMPFGEELAPDPTYRTASLKYGSADRVRQKFTGYQRDDESDLDFAEARYYNHSHGRFTAVDPLLASGQSANPQTFNRYAYVMNSPLRFTDPLGLCPDDGRATTQPCEVTPSVQPQSANVRGRIVNETGDVLVPSVEFILQGAMLTELTEAGELVETTQVAFDRDRLGALEYAAASLNQVDVLEWGSETRAIITTVGTAPALLPLTSDGLVSAFSELDPNEVMHTYVDNMGMLNLPTSVTGSSVSANVGYQGPGVTLGSTGASYGLSTVVGELQENSNNLNAQLQQRTSDAASHDFANRHAATPVNYQVLNNGAPTGVTGAVPLTKHFLYKLHQDRVKQGLAAAGRR